MSSNQRLPLLLPLLTSCFSLGLRLVRQHMLNGPLGVQGCQGVRLGSIQQRLPRRIVVRNDQRLLCRDADCTWYQRQRSTSQTKGICIARLFTRELLSAAFHSWSVQWLPQCARGVGSCSGAKRPADRGAARPRLRSTTKTDGQSNEFLAARKVPVSKTPFPYVRYGLRQMCNCRMILQ